LLGTRLRSEDRLVHGEETDWPLAEHDFKLEASYDVTRHTLIPLAHGRRCPPFTK
ncbi:hypothetical protein Dimus_024688, partial [Dionaea muscipula]